MHKAKYDLSVLLIFFARPNTLQEVFEKVKEARPSRLFLACDGPREDHPTDKERIEQCKAIVSDIDWECEVHTLYSDVNKGCGKGPSDAISWAFTHTDKLVILEDDCVPHDSFFPYMEYLLNRYADDERVGMISGLNHFKDWDCGGYSYCFTKSGAIWGWGTWKRVWDQYDYYLSRLDEPYCRALLEKEICHKRAARGRMAMWNKTAAETRVKKVQHWDYQFGFTKYTQSLLCIVPKTNLICNIGAGADSTHAKTTHKSQWKKGMVLFMPTASLEMPLRDPPYMVCDRNYDEKYFNTMAYPSVIVKYAQKIKRRLFKA